MTKRILSAGALLCAVVAAAPAGATTTVFTTTLAGANETPATPSTATGTATLTYDSVLHSLLVAVSFAGLAAPAGAGHIHCCVAPGGNVDVAVPFTGLAALTTGSYSRTFALDSSGSYLSAFVTANGGTADGAEKALVAGLMAGTAYVNLHDATYPNGEIRGFVVTSVPEPASVALLLAGLGAVGLATRRRRLGAER